MGYSFWVATGADTLRAHLDRRHEAARQRARARAEALREGLPRAVEILRRHGATKVVLFGSLATGEERETSDVDLAVWGLPAARHFAAMGELMAHFVAPVDLVRIEDAPDSLRERIDAEGQEL